MFSKLAAAAGEQEHEGSMRVGLLGMCQIESAFSTC